MYRSGESLGKVAVCTWSTARFGTRSRRVSLFPYFVDTLKLATVCNVLV